MVVNVVASPEMVASPTIEVDGLTRPTTVDIFRFPFVFEFGRLIVLLNSKCFEEFAFVSCDEISFLCN